MAYTRLSLPEREEISRCLAENPVISWSEPGRLLGRHRLRHRQPGWRRRGMIRPGPDGRVSLCGCMAVFESPNDLSRHTSQRRAFADQYDEISLEFFYDRLSGSAEASDFLR